ncbi:MAG: hypothetical protein JWN09_71 [Microbacteriaceae bacterium]|jgi:hypothetical protein|nr:hypothetical protein [Microbacteriaceae bacterium]
MAAVLLSVVGIIALFGGVGALVALVAMAKSR